MLTRGREKEVPELVMGTLQHTRLRHSSLHSPFAQQAIKAIEVSRATDST